MEDVKLPGALPVELGRLEFLIGEFAGLQTLFPPGGEAVRFEAAFTGMREACDRFVSCDYAACIPRYGDESFRAMITFNTKRRQFEMWMFSSSAEEPLVMTGNFDAGALVMVSEPWAMPWGLQRLRTTFSEVENEGVEIRTDLFEIEGWIPFRHTRFQRQHAWV